MEPQVNASISSPSASAQIPATPLDLVALKARQQATWSTGDFSIIGTTLQIVGESLCEAVDLQADEAVLDVACGNGNAALAAARRFARVTGVDYVPSLIERARERARGDRLDVDFQVGDGEALPFGDGGFDVVLSTYGIMFTADAERGARELLRVCRPRGRIGMANWTPEGFIGQLFRVVGRHVRPPAGAPSPSAWGTEARLRELFGSEASTLHATRRPFVFRYRSAQHWIEVFRSFYGPVKKAFEALDASGQRELEVDLLDLLSRFNASKGSTLAVPAEYLEVVISRR